jgi:hypothetical protein
VSTQAASRVSSGSSKRLPHYDPDGWLRAESKTGGPNAGGYERRLRYDAAGCLREVQSGGAGAHSTTTYLCGQKGRTCLAGRSMWSMSHLVLPRWGA